MYKLLAATALVALSVTVAMNRRGLESQWRTRSVYAAASNRRLSPSELDMIARDASTATCEEGKRIATQLTAQLQFWDGNDIGDFTASRPRLQPCGNGGTDYYYQEANASMLALIKIRH